MNQRENCNFFLLRYVPDAVKNEFVNIGLVLLPERGAPEVRFARDFERVKCLDPQADVELLEAMESDLRSKLLQGDGDRDFILRRIQDSFSNALQTSEYKPCLAESPAREADALSHLYLETPRHRQRREVSSRRTILDRMKSEFESFGVWNGMWREIAVGDYTGTRDPLKIDCGYGNGSVKLFQALAISNEMSSVNTAKVLAFTFPALAAGIRQKAGKTTLLTAIVEDHLDRNQDLVDFALETLERQSIAIAPLAEMGKIAAQAAKDIGTS